MSEVHAVKGRILLCTCGSMTEPAKTPGDMWRAFEAHQAQAAAEAKDEPADPGDDEPTQ